MQIKSPKDFWAGLMFIGFGVFFAVWAIYNYQMGSAVRMGPAYFPTVLGGLLAVLGTAVLAGSFAMRAGGQSAALRLPFTALDVVVVVAVFTALGVLANYDVLSRDAAIVIGTAAVGVLAILFRPATKPLVLICAACVAYGYVMKPLGLVLSTGLLIFISAFGGHEFRWKEVAILYVTLVVFSVLVFVKGLTLPFPLWPAFVG